MKLALGALKNDARLKSTVDTLELVDVEIETTHLYVRFLPNDSLELEQLENDSLILFDYPLDYEIEEGGEYYQDPSIPEGQITWQYTTVKVDYEFPSNIKYEILEECFIMDDEDDYEDDESELKSTQNNAWALLEYKAMDMTNNFTEKEKAEQNELKGWLVPSAKNPTGYIKVYNTSSVDYVGVRGVKVRVHRIVKISYGTTNAQGKYKVHKKFRYNCFYGLRFQSSTGVKLWKWYTTLTYARYSMGVHGRSGYSRKIPKSSVAWSLCTVMNGVYDYYNYICPKYEITKPYSNLRICVINNASKGGAPMLRRITNPVGYNSNSTFTNVALSMGLVYSSTLLYIGKNLMPDIMIGAKSKQTAKIYDTTIHELAHASHFTKVGSSFWAKYISYIITYGSYGDGTGKNADLCALGEMWGYYMGYKAAIDSCGASNNAVYQTSLESFTPKEPPYTSEYKYTNWLPKGLLWDLADSNKDIVNSITDKAYGFTPKQFFNALDSDVLSPQDFKDRLMKETNNKQKTYVDELFEAYYWN